MPKKIKLENLKEIKIKKYKIHFDETRHNFYDDKGVKIPSVSSIIKSTNDKSDVLINWAVNQVITFISQNKNNFTNFDELLETAKKEWKNVRDEAKNIGSAVHEWIRKFIDLGDTAIETTDNQVINGIQAFLKWQKENKVNFLETEKILYHPDYNYCGIMDLLIEVNNKQKILCDFKTGNYIYKETNLQLAGYYLAYTRLYPKIKIDGRAIIHLNKNTGDFIFYKIENDLNKDIDAFINCLNLYNWKIEK